MPGPPPKPNAVRRNDREAGFSTLTGRRSEIPKLPSVKGQRWSAATRQAWARWWASPQATRWTDDDIPQVVLAARFYEGALQGDPKAMTEFRQWADRFGFSPLARLRNRWIVPAPASEVAEDEAEPVAAPAGVAVLDEYRGLYETGA